MKKLRNLITVMAVASMAAVFTGCDDEGDEGNNGNQNPPANNFAPATEADLTAQNKVYTVNVAGQADPITLRFPSAGNYELTQSGVTEIGTIAGSSKTGESWQFNVTPAAGQAGAQEGVLRLDW